jgi:sortase A
LYVSDSLQARVYASYEETRLTEALKAVEHVAGPPLPRDKGDFIGQLDIPRIGLRTVVLEGDDDHTLRFGAGHVPGTAFPGESGNVSLAAHRDSFFHALLNIRRNDQIRLTTFSGFHDYRVDWIRVVKPRDVEVLRPIGRPILTLITCYPFHFIGSAPERFVVRAHQIPE